MCIIHSTPGQMLRSVHTSGIGIISIVTAADFIAGKVYLICSPLRSSLRLTQWKQALG
jgi:hypothetical protein